METWLPPEGMTGTTLAFEFREGGMYRMRLSYDNQAPVPGKTTEHADTAFSGQMRIIWIFDEGEQGTTVTVCCEDVPKGIGPEDHVSGLASSLRNLARFTEGAR